MSKKKVIMVAAIAVACTLILCAGVYAAVSYGSKEDPLISKSYVEEVLRPELEAQIKAELDAALADVETAQSADFKVITLSAGQKLTCGVGCEMMLRIGSATAKGADYPVLVDTSTGESVADGTALKVNHLYMVTIQGNGITAGAATTKLLIRGDYTIS